jgi:hypothetical protein
MVLMETSVLHVPTELGLGREPLGTAEAFLGLTRDQHLCPLEVWTCWD